MRISPLPTCATVIISLACNQPEQVSTRSTTRDSAGAQIVESIAPVWGANTSWKLADTPSVVIGDATHVLDEAPLDPVNVWFSSSGSIVLADGDQSGWHAFLVYSRTGEFERKISREGEGPGEFGQLWLAFPYRGDSLLGFDTPDQSLTVFGLDGGFGREFRLPSLAPPHERIRGVPGQMSHVIGPATDGTILYTSSGALAAAEPGFAWYERELVRLSEGGNVIDSLGIERSSQQYWSGSNASLAPFAPMAMHAVGQSTYFTTTGESFSVHEYTLDGTLQRVMKRSFDRARVTEHDKEMARSWYLGLVSGSREPANLESIQRSMDEWRFPEFKSAVSGLLVDDIGSIWVEHSRWFVPGYVSPEPTPSVWTVFAPTGEWLGDVHVPARFILRDVQGDRVIGINVDENDLESILVFELLK